MNTNTPQVCPICSKKDTNFALVRAQSLEEGLFKLFQCDNCDMQFWFPFANLGPDWYEDRYDPAAYALDQSFRNAFRMFFSKNDIRHKKLLDLGCGAGAFINEANKRGADVSGVDFNRHAIEFIKEHYGIDNVFLIKSFEDYLSHATEAFSIVTCFEVLEHQDNPVDFLRAVRGILREDGLLALSVPYRDAIASQKNSFEHPLNHLTRWSKKSINFVLSESGFDVVVLKRVDDFDLTLDTLLVFLRSVEVGRYRLVRAQGKPSFLGRVLVFFAIRIAPFVCWLRNRLGVGNSLYLECRIKEK